MRDHDQDALRLTLDPTQPTADRLAAITRLGGSKDPGLVLPLSVLLGESSGALRDALAAALERLGATAVLPRLLGDASEARAIAATLGLKALHDPRVVPALLQALGDARAKVREHAASGFITQPDLRAVAALCERLRVDVDPDVRGAAAQALGSYDDAASLEALATALEHDADAFVRLLVRGALDTRRARAS